MKKSILILLLFTGMTSIASYGQVTKTDIESAITAVGGSSKFTTLFVTNIKQLMNDGTMPFTWYEYKFSESGYELTTTSIILKGYTDNTKSQIKNLSIYPYDNIAAFRASADGFSVRLKNTLVI